MTTTPTTQDARTGHEAGRLSFGPFALEADTGRLLEGERVIPLAPKPFETLLYLARHSGRVVPKTELMEKLWPDTFVTDDVLVQCIVDVRRALGDHAKTPQYVQTLPRRGYLFLATVTLPRPDGAPAPPPTVPSTEAAAPVSGGVGRWAPLALAAGLVVAVVAWLAGSRAAGPGLAVSSAEAVEHGSLVVMPLAVEEPTPQSGWLRHGLAEMIRSQLGQTPGIHVVARHRLASALAEAGYDEDREPSADAAAAITRKLGVERMVTGSFVRVENDFVVTAQVTELSGGRTLGTASVRGKLPGELLDAVDDLCLKLLHELRTGENATRAPWRPKRVATQSIEAYRLYVEALSLFARGGRAGAEEAEARLDRALALDPAFAQAYVKKAEIQRFRRQWGYGDPDPAPAVRAAARLVKDLPDRERQLVESFEAWIVKGDTGQALRHWNALLQFYPTYAQEVGIPTLVADAFLREGRWDDLILVGEAHVDSASLPDAEKAWLNSLLATAFRRKGEFERALDHARRAVRYWPRREGPRYLAQSVTLGRMGLEAGRREEALAEFRAVAQAAEADVTNLTDAAWGLYMAGETLEARALVARALALDDAYGNAYHLRGWIEMASGDHASAARSLETAFERTPRSFGNPHQGNVGGDLAALYYAGVAHLRSGQDERGRQVLERLRGYCRRLQEAGRAGGAAEWQAASFEARAAARLGLPAKEPARLQGDDTTYFVQSARLHAVQGKREQALRELGQGVALGHGEHRHIRDDPDFESLRRAPEFERLLRDAAQPETRAGG